MAPPARAHRGGLVLPLLLVAIALAALLAGSLLPSTEGFVPPARLPAAAQRGAAGPARGSVEPADAGAEAQAPPSAGTGRRSGVLLAACAAVLGAACAGVRGARAFELESNRVATYQSKARQLNEAVDWYVFEIRPLLYPAQELMEMSSCEDFGDNCAERAGLAVIYEQYQTNGASRGGGQVVVSKLDRDLFTPMKLLAMSSVFDPDTEDTLASDVQKMELSQYQLAKAAKKGELDKVKKLYNDGKDTFNSYFTKVNAETGLPPNSEYYLTPIPDTKALEEDQYWVRRKQKWLVKKKVDAVSKGSKTARFYAKSMFGDDAVSWDPRGDRAEDFYEMKK